jgi:ribosomal-protein-alanine N-acetyltransferase
MNLQFAPFPNLVTPRLQLRRMTLSDDQEILVQRSDPRLLQYIDIQRAHNLDDARQFIQKIETGIAENKNIYWAICLKDAPALIGTICLWNLDTESAAAEIGYAMHPDFQGQGLMQEALEAVTHYALTVLEAKTVSGYVHPDNRPSCRLLEKNGFAVQGRDDGLLVYAKLF